MLKFQELNYAYHQNKTSIIWLHGLGSDGYDLMNVVTLMQISSDLTIYSLFPHAPFRMVEVVGDNVRAWFDMSNYNGINYKEKFTDIEESEKLIKFLIDKEINRGIPSNRIILVGFSQGGVMALRMCMNFNQQLAGIIAISAWVPLMKENKFNIGINCEKKNCLNTPIFIMHGINDNIIPIKFADASTLFLKNRGFHNILYKYYSTGHSICLNQINDIDKWIKELIKH